MYFEYLNAVKKNSKHKTWQVFWGSVNYDQTGRASVSQRICVCMSVMRTSAVHILYSAVCVCTYLYMPSDRETDVMQRLRNLFPDFFKQASVDFLALMHHSGVFDLQPPHPLAMTDSSSDDTQWKACTVVVFSLPDNVECLISISWRLFPHINLTIFCLPH